MTDVNRIGVNTQGINSRVKQNSQGEDKNPGDVLDKKSPVFQEIQKVAAEEVLAFMAQTAAVIVQSPNKDYKAMIVKYIDSVPGSRERIEKSVKDFEDATGK